MKRTKEPEEPSGRVKRAKTLQACTSCKKAKTRCEILTLEPNKAVSCHRCRVLNNSCSYGEMDRTLFSHLATKSSPTVKSSSSSGSDSTRETTWNSVTVPANISDSETEFPRPDLIWSYVKARGPLDWSAPLNAIQELAKQPFIVNETPPAMTDRSLHDILSQPQIEHLLGIFESSYIPWLNFSFIRDTNNSLLDLVSCTIASRHLDISLRAGVAPRLQKLTEDIVVKMIFNPRGAESLDSIQCLLILSLWSPICGNSESTIKDGKLLIASALSMAMNLHLDDSSSQVMAMKESLSKDPSSVNEAYLTSLVNKARLWTCLTNIESLLCTGSGRMPLSRRTPEDAYLIPMTPRSPETVAEGRDLRVRLLSELFNVSEKARSIRLVTPTSTAVDSWYDAITDVLGSHDRLRRLIAPLEVVADDEKFHFQMLHLVSQCCRLLIYYFALYDARAVFNEKVTSGSPVWFTEIRPHGMGVVVVWAKEILVLGEAMLISTLRSDSSSLATAPDHILNMIAFAAGLVVGIKFLMLNNAGIDLLGSTDKLLSKVHEHLTAATISEDHSAKRCTQLVGAMIETWNNRGQPDGPGLHYTLPAIPINSSPQVSPNVHSQQDAWSTSGDLLQDNDFWLHFFTQM